jgi:NADH-quinone oxidoreductase subunit A
VLAQYLPVVFMAVFAVGAAALLLVISALLGPRRTGTNLTPYECGVPPVGDARVRFDVKFYLVAMLFILFDIEAVFLYPWSVVYRDFIAAGHGLYLFTIMMIFLAILVVGLLYEWKKGALEWD